VAGRIGLLNILAGITLQTHLHLAHPVGDLRIALGQLLDLGCALADELAVLFSALLNQGLKLLCARKTALFTWHRLYPPIFRDTTGL